MLTTSKKNLVFCFFIFLICLSFPRRVWATRTISIEADKVSILGEEEIVITASASGFLDNETIYIKGAFYQESSSTNYFGYTKKADTWIKNSQATLEQLSVKIGEWDNILKVKSDFLDSNYKGEGVYKFKIGFTSSDNLSSVQWSSNVLSIEINEPDPTSTPTPTPTPEPTSTPQSTNTPTPTQTPAPTATPTVTPTPKLTIAPTMFKTELEGSESASFEEVLGTNDAAQNGLNISLDDSEPSTLGAKIKGSGFNFWPFLFIIPGAGMIAFSLLILAKQKKDPV